MSTLANLLRNYRTPAERAAEDEYVSLLIRLGVKAIWVTYEAP